MKWCRFQKGEKISYGVVQDNMVLEVSGSPFEDHVVTSTIHPLGEVALPGPRDAGHLLRGGHKLS